MGRSQPRSARRRTRVKPSVSVPSLGGRPLATSPGADLTSGDDLNQQLYELLSVANPDEIRLGELLEALGLTRDELKDLWPLTPEGTLGNIQHLLWSLVEQRGDEIEWAFENGVLADMLTFYFTHPGPTVFGGTADEWREYFAELAAEPWHQDLIASRHEAAGDVWLEERGGWYHETSQGTFVTPGQWAAMNRPEPVAGAQPGAQPGAVVQTQGAEAYISLLAGLGISLDSATLTTFGRRASPGGPRPSPGGPRPSPTEAGHAESLLFAELGMGGAEFYDLIDQAIRESWSPEQLESAIYQSPIFEKMFPGIKRADGSLRMSASEWRSLYETYQDIGRDFGVDVTRNRMGLLLAGQTSPDEFALRIQAIQNVRANPNLRSEYNEQLRLAGYSPLDEQGFFRWVAGALSPEYYDIYEAALLRTSAGLNLTFEQAREVGRAVGQPGSPADIPTLVANARSMIADIGPELSALGITDADLLQLAAGSDPKGIEPRVRAIVQQRRARSGYVPGAQGYIGPGGGYAVLGAPEEPASY